MPFQQDYLAVCIRLFCIYLTLWGRGLPYIIIVHHIAVIAECIQRIALLGGVAAIGF